MQTLPKMNIMRKSADRPRNEFSSSIRQYRYVKIMLKMKLNPNVPKNRNVVTSRHNWKQKRKTFKNRIEEYLKSLGEKKTLCSYLFLFV